SVQITFMASTRSHASLWRITKAVPWLAISSSFQPLPTQETAARDLVDRRDQLGKTWPRRCASFSPSWRRSRTRWPAMHFVSLSIGCDDLRTSRPPRLRAWQHLLDQQTGLGQDGVVIAAQWPQDELRYAGVDIFGKAREDRVGIADREHVSGGAAGEFDVGIHRAGDGPR